AEAARLALAVNADASPTARLAIAGALLAAGNSAEAETQARLLGADPRLTGEQRRELAALRAGSAIRTADRLNEEGQQAQAYDQLAPLLAADPENPSIRLALARLHNGARQPEEARRIAEAVLARDPRNLDARMTAADAAILAGDRARAESLLEEALALHPMDARVKLMEARIARASGNDRRAMRALREAQELRRIQLGQAATGGAEAAGLAAPNPFLRQVSFGGSATAPSSAGLGAPPLRDQVSMDIARELASVQEEGASRLQGGVALRSRSGTAGLDRLQEFSAPLEASIRSETLNGRIVARVTPVTVSTGSLSTDADSLRRFGSNALNPGAAARPREDASGVGLGLAYQRPNFTLDAGTTPLGFLKENMLGGVEFAPLLNDSLRLRVTGERRAVTDSLLSWGGQRDPLSGRSWGGVTRTGGRAQLEYTTGPVTIYGGGGWSSFDGSGVADNSRVEAGAGFSYAVLRKPGEELTSGLDLVYFGYDKNLRYFTLGQGGYFSPQSFTAVNIPVDYRARWGELDYRVGGSLGYTNWHESSSPLYPNDPGLQRSLEAQAAGDPTLSTHYNGQTRNGVIGGVRLDGSYPLTDSLQIGGTLRYDRAANWNETRAMVYLRQRLGP
ncbi:MAG: cellulose synthase subunit BcsC-related outer membrane protein, partial [Paracraurococcus sp.]